MKKIVFVFSLVFLFSVSSQLYAQMFWQETNGPTGGYVQCLALDKYGNLYSGFDAGWWGLNHKGNCFYKQPYDSNEWESVNSIVYNKDVESILVDSSGYLYIWLGGSGVARSTNNGSSWTKIWSGSGINSFYTGSLGLCRNNFLVLANYDGVFISSDYGTHWNLSSLTTQCRYCFVDNNDNIFVAIYNQGLYKSTDHGINWVNSSNGINGEIKSMIQLNENMLFAVTEFGVFKSLNSGENWIKSNSNLDNVTSICKGTNDQIFVGTESAGCYSSDDYGETWVEKNGGLKRLYITSLISLPSGNIVAGTYGDGMYIYSESEVKWVEYNSGIKSIHITSFIKHNDFLFAGSERGIIFKSSDDGNNWIRLKSPIIYTPILSFGKSLKGSLLFSTWQYMDYFLDNSSISKINSKSNLGVDRIYRSSDGGYQWKEVAEVYVFSFTNYFDPLSNTEYLFAAAGWDGVYSSTNDGETWFPVNNHISGEHIEDIVASTTGYIYASSPNKIYRSDDYGKSWVTVYSGNSSKVLEVTSNNFLFAGLDYGKVIVSTDNGNSWLDRGENLPLNRVNAIVRDSLDNIFVGNWDGEIYESVDLGINWADVKSGSVAGLTKNIYCDENGYVFIGQYGSNVLKSSKVSFATLPPILIYPQNSINQPLEIGFKWKTSVLVDSFKFQVGTSNLFDTTSIFLEKYLSDSSLTVSGFSENTTYFWRVLGIDKFGEGNWSNIVSFKTKKVVSVDDDNSLNITFNLSQNHPNPFNPSTSIQYAISSTQFVTLKVYDLLGREVATLVNEEKPAGSYNVEFGMQNFELSSGIYFYKLQAGDFVETKKMILLK